LTSVGLVTKVGRDHLSKTRRLAVKKLTCCGKRCEEIGQEMGGQAAAEYDVRYAAKNKIKKGSFTT
jgi:hypothetical protein